MSPARNLFTLTAGSLAIAFAVLAATAVAAPGARLDTPMLVVNKQIGDMRMGESEAKVGYYYGSDCIAGCSGIKDGCVLGLKDCMGPIYDYKVQGGTIRVGYRNHHVVFLETTAPRYTSSTGLHVGGTIPFGSRWGPFKWHACDASSGYWTAGTSWKAPLWKNGATRWWTQASVDKGVVVDISMWRGDVNPQEC